MEPINQKYECEICKSRYDSFSEAEECEKAHNSNGTGNANMEMAKCIICNRDFQDQRALDMHNSVKHNLSQKNIIENPPKIMNKTVFLIVGVLAVIIISYFSIGSSATGNVVSGDTQKITLSYKNYNYYPNTITVESGKPVEITLDSSVGGCYRSFNIMALGVSEYSSNPSDTVKFTPTTKGSFEFACGMRMGRGTIIVN